MCDDEPSGGAPSTALLCTYKIRQTGLYLELHAREIITSYLLLLIPVLKACRIRAWLCILKSALMLCWAILKWVNNLIPLLIISLSDLWPPKKLLRFTGQHKRCENNLKQSSNWWWKYSYTAHINKHTHQFSFNVTFIPDPDIFILLSLLCSYIPLSLLL